MLTLQELRQLTDQDLINELEQTSRDLMKLQMDLESGYSKESHNKKKYRAYIAQIKTIQTENLKDKKEKSESKESKAN